MDREKVVKGLECHADRTNLSCNIAKCPYYELDFCGVRLSQDALELLKEQQGQIDRLLEENASNAEMAEGLKELLKEQGNCENCAIAIDDRQPIVRCKDCIYKNGLNHCPHNNDIWVADDWFCAHGKREDS